MDTSTFRPFSVPIRWLVAGALGATAPAGAIAQAPAFRVADINTQPVVRSSSPRQFHTAGDLTFFAADGATGPAVWRTDGHADGAAPLFALPTGALQHAAAIDGGYLLVVDHDTHRALLRSDGTAAGTRVVATLLNMPHWRSPASYATHGGALYFLHGDPTTGTELWRSDGTAAGTRLVYDVRPGSNGSEIRFIGSTAGMLLFSAEDGEINGSRLWRTDGTFAGTWRVNRTYVTPGARSAVVDGVVYFVGTIGSRFDRAELWRSDGTAEGTFSVRPGLTVQSLFPVGDGLFLAAAEPLGAAGLVRSDGTAAGTDIVAAWDAGPASDLEFLADAGGILLFHRASDGDTLWRSDGSAEGTQAVATLPTPDVCTSAIDGDGALWLVIDDTLWRSDGTSAGTAALAPMAPTRGPYQTCDWPLIGSADGGVVFAGNGSEGAELWHSDGTAAGTGPLANLAVDSDTTDADPERFTMVGDVLYFTADDGTHGRELWRSDGSAPGTRLVADLRAGSDSAFGAALGDFGRLFFGDRGWVAAGNQLHFVANDGAGNAVWRSDGTPAGTVRLTASETAAGPRNLTMVAGVLFFLAHDADGAVVLWRSDGTATGTVPLRVLADGTAEQSVGHLVDLAGELFFAVGTTLWRSDGSAAGTRPVREFPSAISHATALDGRLFLGASGRDASGMHYVTDVWQSDGSADGTVLIAGLEGAVGLSHVTALQDVTFFVTLRRYWGWYQDALWLSDGTAAGTRMVAGLSLAAYYGTESSHSPVTLGGHLYMLGNSSSGRVGLLRADSAGDITPLATFAAANALVEARGQLLFGACDHPDDCGLWESDGSPAGTRLVARAGNGLIYKPGEWPDHQLAVGSDLAFFTHADPLAGRELWALPLSALGSCGSESCGECAGDCDGDAVVDIAELLAMVRAMLGSEAPPCQAGDTDRSGVVTVDEAVAAIGRALDGCE